MPGFCFAQTTAQLRIYKRLYLWNQDAQIENGPPFCNFGDVRLGMPAYNAQINTQLQGKLNPLPRNIVHCGNFVYGFFRPADDDQKFWNIMGAMGHYTFKRDHVVVRTGNHRVATFGAQHISGDGLQSGQIVERSK